jgi:hypothetical protein
MIALLALLLIAPPEFKVIADLANYLSQGNAPGAMEAFDRNMPGYQKLADNIFAMTAQADISCTIDPIEQTGKVIEVDWFLKLNSKAEQGPTERRQQTVKITIEKIGKSFKIINIEPLSILGPPRL